MLIKPMVHVSVLFAITGTFMRQTLDFSWNNVMAVMIYYKELCMCFNEAATVESVRWSRKFINKGWFDWKKWKIKSIKNH